MPLRYQTYIHTLRHHWQGGRRVRKRIVKRQQLFQHQSCNKLRSAKVQFSSCAFVLIKMMVSEGSEGMDAYLINSFMLTDM